MHTCFIEGVSALISHWIAALWNKYDRFWTEHKKYIVLNELILYCLKNTDNMRNKKMIVWMILQCVIWCMYASPRLKMTINENWRFTKGDIPAAKTRTFYDKGWEIIHLPHTWNTVDTEDESPGYYRGVGWYRKEIQIGRDVEFRKIFLCFEAANQVTEVWINGKKAGEPHKGGYTPFTYGHNLTH